MGRFEEICEAFSSDRTAKSNGLMLKLKRKLKDAGISVISFLPRDEKRLNEPELEIVGRRIITLDLNQTYHPYTLWRRDDSGGRVGEGFPKPNRPNVPHDEIQDQIVAE